jgi:hypothetical protein
MEMNNLIVIKDREVGDRIKVGWHTGDETEETITGVTRSYYKDKFIGWSYSLDSSLHGSSWCMESWIIGEVL